MTLGEQLAQYLASGLVVGGAYALIGLGFVIVYNVTRIINFAQGEFVMLGALGMVTCAGLGLPPLPAFVLVVAAVAALAAALEQTKNFVGITGVFDFSPTEHNGLDRRAVTMIQIVDGQWRPAR